jgi:hypothetical protein
MTEDEDREEIMRRALAVSQQIEVLLHGQGPHVQGAVLAQLTAMWVCGFHPKEARRQIFEDHCSSMRVMIEMDRDH